VVASDDSHSSVIADQRKSARLADDSDEFTWRTNEADAPLAIARGTYRP